MDNQMEMAFMNQGGLKDDGMKQDPISGNPIPNGSMAEEVRDDIPAQLSEGEYVVPADVVRYYGVKHFEDIRNKAKTGLQSMEKNGRIGGEPVPVGGPTASGLNPEEMNEIQSMMMNIGGFVNQPSDPYKQQRTMYKQPMAMGAANGTDVSGSFSTNYYNPNNPNATAQAITTASPQSGSFSTKPQQTAPVSIDTPESCTARGMMYNAVKKMCVPIIPESVTPKDDDPRDPDVIGSGTGDGSTGFKGWDEGINWNAPNGALNFAKNIFQETIDPKTGKFIRGAGFALAGLPGAAIGTVIGGIPALTKVAKLKAAAGIATDQRKDKDADEILKMAEEILKGQSGFINFIDDIFATGNAFKAASTYTLGTVPTPTKPVVKPTSTSTKTIRPKAIPETSKDDDEPDFSKIIKDDYKRKKDPITKKVKPYAKVDDDDQTISVTSSTKPGEKQTVVPKGDLNVGKEQESSINVGGPGFRNKGGLMIKKKKGK